MAWNNDMSAAPRDGRNILAWCKCATTGEEYLLSDVGFSPLREIWISDGEGTVNPTHWMHLPTPPQEQYNAE